MRRKRKLFQSSRVFGRDSIVLSNLKYTTSHTLPWLVFKEKAERQTSTHYNTSLTFQKLGLNEPSTDNRASILRIPSPAAPPPLYNTSMASSRLLSQCQFAATMVLYPSKTIEDLASRI